MKYSSLFAEYLNCSDSEEVFNYFQANLVNSINIWEYFVNWKKVEKNFKSMEINLNLLNYLVGKNNIEDEFRQLIKEYPKRNF